jgi:hypothetical protein
MQAKDFAYRNGQAGIRHTTESTELNKILNTFIDPPPYDWLKKNTSFLSAN